jgi:predicted short-subunit dehydrogenase-like oxidoreductase (DUF2520 family)
MAGKPRITLVGAGNLSSALASALRRAGYSIDTILARKGDTSMRRARSLAREVGSRAAAVADAQISSQVVWFCVPDGQISTAARSLARSTHWKGKVALHSSGALTSDELAQLRRRGAAVASVHPLMTFVRGSRPSLAGVPFAIEGDAAAVRLARRIVKDLSGQAFPIRKRDKVAYHAWGTLASPLFVALLATTERVAESAGVKGRAGKRRMLPILQQTLANYAALDAASAFSGPIVRGDADTVSRHLRALRLIPEARGVYLALARAAVCYLPVKKRALLERILKSDRNKRSKEE